MLAYAVIQYETGETWSTPSAKDVVNKALTRTSSMSNRNEGRLLERLKQT